MNTANGAQEKGEIGKTGWCIYLFLIDEFDLVWLHVVCV